MLFMNKRKKEISCLSFPFQTERRQDGGGRSLSLRDSTPRHDPPRWRTEHAGECQMKQVKVKMAAKTYWYHSAARIQLMMSLTAQPCPCPCPCPMKSGLIYLLFDLYAFKVRLCKHEQLKWTRIKKKNQKQNRIGTSSKSIHPSILAWEGERSVISFPVIRISPRQDEMSAKYSLAMINNLVIDWSNNWIERREGRLESEINLPVARERASTQFGAARRGWIADLVLKVTWASYKRTAACLLAND